MAAEINMALCYVCAFVLLLSFSHGYVLKRHSDTATDSVQKISSSHRRIRRNIHETSVEHFAIHELCRDYHGKRYFYRVLKSKLCNIDSNFIASLVIDMCLKRDAELIKWVKELFDINDDDHISYLERHYHSYDD